MSTRSSLLAFAVAVSLAPAAARAEGIQGRWSVGLQGGTDIELSGNVHEGGSGTVLGLATSVQKKSFADVYDPSFRGQLSVGYGVGARSELFLRGSYYKMSSQTLQVGTVAGLELNADFADYKEWGLEAGFRHYLSERSPQALRGRERGRPLPERAAVDLQRPGGGRRAQRRARSSTSRPSACSAPTWASPTRSARTPRSASRPVRATRRSRAA